MRVSIGAGLATLALLLGCGGLEGVLRPPGPAPEAPEPPAPPEPPEPAPPPALQAPTSAPFEGLTGWVGHGIGPDRGWWIPAEGSVVVSWDTAPWEGVGLGTTFSGASASGAVELSFTGVGPVPLCGGTVPAATFSAPRAVEGTVWITPAPSGLKASAPRQARAATATRRLYRLPSGAEVDISRTGAVGRTVVEWGGARPWLHAFRGAVDLRRADAVGPMWPELVLLDTDSMSVVFRIHEPDGVGWEWVRIEGRKGTSLGRTRLAITPCG